MVKLNGKTKRKKKKRKMNTSSEFENKFPINKYRK